MAFWSTEHFARAARERKHNYDLRIQLSDLLGNLRDAEVGQKGYLLTGKKEYLEPFVAGSTAVTRNLSGLRKLTLQDQLEQPQLRGFEPLIQARLAERALAGERAYVTDLEIHQPGRVVPVECWSAPVFDAAGRVVWAIVAFSDATERKQGEAELRSSEERARLIVDAAYDAFVAIDSDSVITAWNRQAEATFGWSREEVIGRNLVETIIPPQHREAHRRGLAHFLATGEGPVLNRRIEITALRGSGEEFPVELAIWPLRLGDRYYFNAFLRDITERKRAEEELRQAKEAAETANYAKSDFLAKMSHELRTPLNSIIGFSEMLQDTTFGALNEKQHRYVVNVLTSGRSLLQLINDILDLSKVESGRMDLAYSEFDIGTALAEVRTIVGTLANKKHLASRWRWRVACLPSRPIRGRSSKFSTIF
jgi:PAS domain S-box-containing protein